MEPQVLLYGLTPAEEAGVLRLCLSLGLRAVVVPPEHYGWPLEQAAGLVPGGAPRRAALPAPMLVFVWLSSEQLDACLAGLRRQGITVALKATLTAANRSWPAPRLCRELQAEHAAWQRRTRED